MTLNAVWIASLREAPQHEEAICKESAYLERDACDACEMHGPKNERNSEKEEERSGEWSIPEETTPLQIYIYIYICR